MTITSAARGGINSVTCACFGIDCGTNCTGYGVVEVQSGRRETRLIAVAAGGLRLAKDQPLPMRLAYIFSELSALLELHRPDVVAVEEVFYSVNAKSALKLGHVRGVALLAAAMQGLPVAEYAPLYHQIRSRWLWVGAERAGAVHGRAPAEPRPCAGTCRRGRRPGHRDMPRSYRTDPYLAGGISRLRLR